MEKSTFGLPTIGGAITTKQLKKCKYFNQNIANNGSQFSTNQFGTGDDFKIIKQRQTLKFDWVHEKLKKNQENQ